MSGSGSTTTKPVPAPRRGRKTKVPSDLDKLQNVWLLFQNTVRQFYEWMEKFGKCVCCAYQKRRNVTKVGRPTEKQTSLPSRNENLSPQEFALHVEQRLETAPGNCTAMLSQIREELNTPTDNEQLLRLKRMSKSPHSKPRRGDFALQITICENLKSCQKR